MKGNGVVNCILLMSSLNLSFIYFSLCFCSCIFNVISWFPSLYRLHVSFSPFR